MMILAFFSLIVIATLLGVFLAMLEGPISEESLSNHHTGATAQVN